MNHKLESDTSPSRGRIRSIAYGYSAKDALGIGIDDNYPGKKYWSIPYDEVPFDSLNIPSADVVVCRHLLEYCNRPIETIGEMIKRAGKCVILCFRVPPRDPEGKVDGGLIRHNRTELFRYCKTHPRVALVTTESIGTIEEIWQLRIKGDKK